jgi:hypothetical protein
MQLLRRLPGRLFIKGVIQVANQQDEGGSSDVVKHIFNLQQGTGRAVGRFAAPAHGRKHPEDFMCGPRAMMFSCVSDALIKVFRMCGGGGLCN